jgi:hypothetical protein
MIVGRETKSSVRWRRIDVTAVEVHVRGYIHKMSEIRVYIHRLSYIRV